MTLREFLKNEEIEKYRLIVVQDADYMQGVNIMPAAGKETILKDKPVQKYLDCEIVEKKETGNDLFMKVKVEHKERREYTQKQD